MSHATVSRARITFQDTDLRCAVRRSIGWAAYCACGWRGKIRRDLDDAKQDGREHVCKPRPPTDAA